MKTSLLPNVHIFTFSEEGMMSNSYLLQIEKNFFLIDPSHPYHTAKAFFSDENQNGLQKIFSTHAHFDHLLCLSEWKKQSGATYLGHKKSEILTSDAKNNCSALFGKPLLFDAPDEVFQENDILPLHQDYFFQILEVPGHAPDACLLILKKEKETLAVFGGDLIIEDSIGRYDLPLSSPQALFESLHKVISFSEQNLWQENIPFFAGHGTTRTWGEILKNNPYLQRFR